MLTLSISQAEKDKLNYERYNNPELIVQKRLHAVYLKAHKNLNNKEIADCVGLSRHSVRTYINVYLAQGIDGLCKLNYAGPKSEMDNHKTTLVEYFENNPPHSAKQAIAIIKKLTGIERKPTQVRKWMQNNGLKYLKTGQIPAKADADKQKDFLENELEPLIEQAKKGEIHLLFMDSAHFVMGIFLTALWCFRRIFVKSSSGRKRLNVLGAVNAISKKIHFTANTDYINAKSIVEFLYKVRFYYHDMNRIAIVLDNARYQHCVLVKEIAAKLNIQLVFLPPYSPNLNIIERLWKCVKKKVLYATYYEKFEDFSDAICSTLKNESLDFKDELNTLLSLRFQTFEMYKT